MPTLTLTQLRADLTAALGNAVPDARFMDHAPVSKAPAEVQAQVFKDGKVHVWWLESLHSSIGHNVGGTVDFEAASRIHGAISHEEGVNSPSQKDIEDEAHAVIAQIQSEISCLRDIRVISVTPARLWGRNVLLCELSALFFALNI